MKNSRYIRPKRQYPHPYTDTFYDDMMKIINRIIKRTEESSLQQ